MLAYAKKLVAIPRAIEQNLNRRHMLAIDPGRTDFSESSVQMGALDSELSALPEEFEQTRREALEKHPALEDFVDGGDPTEAMKALAKKSSKGAVHPS